MEFRVTTAYDRKFVSSAAWRIYMQKFRKTALLSAGLLLFSLLSILAFGQNTVMTLVLGAALALLAISTLTYPFIRRNYMKTLGGHESLELSFLINDDSISGSSSLGDFTIPWSRVRHIKSFPELLQVWTCDGIVISLPAGDVSEDLLSFIRNKAEDSA